MAAKTGEEKKKKKSKERQKVDKGDIFFCRIINKIITVINVKQEKYYFIIHSILIIID